MENWLYDSEGEPVAYIKEGEVFTVFGGFFGKIDGNEVWKRIYRGEVYEGNRLLVRSSLKGSLRPRRLDQEGRRSRSKRPSAPEACKAFPLPIGFEDVDTSREPEIEESWEHILDYNGKFYAVYYRYTRIDSATALDSLIAKLDGNTSPQFDILYEECDTHQEAEKSLLALISPEPPPLSKELQALLDRQNEPVLPAMAGAFAIVVAILGAFAILQILRYSIW